MDLHPSGVHHIAIKVSDLARAEQFYVQILGLTVCRRWRADDGTADRSVWLDLGADAFLAVERADVGAVGPLGEEDVGWHLVALRIEPAKRQAWIDRLAAAGVPLYRETAYTIYFKDPDGNRVALSHWPEPAAAG